MLGESLVTKDSTPGGWASLMKQHMLVRGTKGGLGGTCSHLVIYESIEEDLKSKWN